MSPREAADLRSSGVKPFILSGHGSYDPRLVIQAVSAIREMKADVIQTWLPQCDIIGAIGSLITSVPMILSERSSAKAYPWGWRRALRQIAGHNARMIIANSPSGLDLWRKHKSRCLIPNALSDPLASTAKDIIAFPTMRPDAKIVICIGRLAKEKNVRQIISAMPHVSEPKTQLLIVGNGPDRTELERLAATHDCANKIIFAGHQLDIHQLLDRATLFVSASLFEGHPNAVLEAAQAGTPLLLSDIPMHHDAVGAGACYFALGDERSLARQIDEVMANPYAAHERAEIAKTQVADLTINKITDAYLKAYRAVCDPKEK